MASANVTVAGRGDTTSYQDDIGAIAYGSAPGLLTNVDHYGLIDFGSSTTAIANGAGKAVKYFTPLTAGGHINGAPTDAEAIAGGWLIKDGTNNYVTYGSDGHVADVGNADYQAACLQIMRDYFTANPTIDGAFIDNFGCRFANYGGASFPIYKQDGVTELWHDLSAFQTAYISFAQNVFAPLKSDGKLVIPNGKGLWNNGEDSGLFTAPTDFGNGPQMTVSWMNAWKTYASGIVIEFWNQNGNSPYQVSLNNKATFRDWWNEWTEFVNTAQSAGLAFYSGNYVVSGTPSITRYLRASFLLNWNGGPGATLFGTAPGYLGDPWTTELGVDVGQPLFAKEAVGSGWKRQFEHYTVYVNPTATTQTLDGHSIASGDALFV